MQYPQSPGWDVVIHILGWSVLVVIVMATVLQRPKVVPTATTVVLPAEPNKWGGVPQNIAWREASSASSGRRASDAPHHQGRYSCVWCGRFSHPRALRVAAHAPACPESPHTSGSRQWWPSIET